MNKQIRVIDDYKHDQLQIEQAAKGCISGTLAEWPDLDAALCKRKLHLPKDTVARTLTEICLLIIADQELFARDFDKHTWSPSEY